MESSNCLPNSKISTYTGRRTIAGSSVVFPQILPSCSESSLVGLKASAESTEVSGHQPPRWASDFFIEEQPFWLEDLLNEPDGLMQRGHRRSTSDTFAYLGESVEDLDLREEPSHRNLTSKALSIRQNIGRNKDSKLFESKPGSLVEKFKDPHIAVSRSAEKQEEEISTQTSEGSNEGISSLSPKPSVSKTEAKRAKQQSAHRSRVRKLQYISQLERTVQLLQAEGSEISAELEFLDHQNLILTMENKALKQRLDSLSQEQLIKQMEQEMLERELGRLQNLYHMQRQQQMQMQQQQQQQQQQHHPKHRRNKSKDLESQLPSVSRKNVRGTT